MTHERRLVFEYIGTAPEKLAPPRHTGEPIGTRGGGAGSGNDRCRALMLTPMRNVPLRRFVIALTSVLVIFAAGTGLYAAALALWPLVLVWWPWLLAGAVAVVAFGA